MDAPTQPCDSQQQVQENTATSVPTQSEPGESVSSPNVGGKRKAEASVECGQEKNTSSNQPPPPKRQHTVHSAATVKSSQNEVAQSEQSHIQSAQA